ncbi:phenylacetate--CoA ligase family protein [Streptomyces sp. NPDC088745]|uniref:phenylacetate--CoA ligase family protein n=1 Tax=Streptomyces sp. NPDC088745 TaxID=3365884 RepID=UPI00380B10D7
MTQDNTPADMSWLSQDIRRARRQGTEGLARRQRARLADAVARARAGSPYYRDLYRGLPRRVDNPALLPVTDKRRLMERFDDWSTDREITYDNIRAFVDDPEQIGQPFLGRYMVATTSGTSGRRGLFVLDDRYLNVGAALMSQALTTWLGPSGILRAAARGGRFAQLVAVGGHYVGFAGNRRAAREGGWRNKILRVFSVHTPLPELVAQLNAYRPAVIIGYTSTIMLLTAEREAGRLTIDPVLLQPAGETMTTADVNRTAAAFGGRTAVRTAYGATECTYLSYSCAQGWYHVNSDWAVVEPVEADYRPTPPGQYSHTVLVTNLANRVQPFLRYDLGDSVLLKPTPCRCGSPLPAIRVQGRAGDILTFPGASGEEVRLSPLALSTLFDRTPGVELFQIVQTAPSVLRVRLRLTGGALPDEVWGSVETELKVLSADNNLGELTIVRAPEPPQQSPGGKYRTVIPLSEGS